MSSETQSGSATPSSAPSEIDRSAARYLVAIQVLSEPDGGRIGTGDLRQHLDVAAATATEMVAKLDDRGLVDYEKYRGVRLTRHGRTAASELSWRFCVVSTFFEAELNADLDDRTAIEMAATLPREGLYALRERIGSPCLGLCPEAGADADACAIH